MRKELFRGAATALVTPFSDGGVDYRALKRLAGYQVSHGADALVVCGTTGESPTLSALEKLRCVSAVCEEVGGRIPVIAGTGTNDTGFSARLSHLACREGADAVLAVAPYYNRPTADGMTGHFLKIAESCGRPLILYNVPSRTGSDIPDAVLESLCKTGAVCGIKEASGSVSRAARIIGRYGKYIDLYSGNDDLTLPLLSIGAKGVISVASNLLPLELHELCRLWFEGRHGECERLYYELLPLMTALFAESNPIPVKAAMAHLGFCSGEVRLPLTAAKPETVAELVTSLKPLLGSSD